MNGDKEYQVNYDKLTNSKSLIQLRGGITRLLNYLTRNPWLEEACPLIVSDLRDELAVAKRRLSAIHGVLNSYKVKLSKKKRIAKRITKLPHKFEGYVMAILLTCPKCKVIILARSTDVITESLSQVKCTSCQTDIEYQILVRRKESNTTNEAHTPVSAS